MVENVLSHIEGIGIYGVISICIFFSVFICTVGWVSGLTKAHLRSMSELPLKDGSDLTQNPHE